MGAIQICDRGHGPLLQVGSLVQSAQRQRFGDVWWRYVRRAFQIRDRSRYAQDTLVSPCREVELVDGLFKKRQATWRQGAISLRHFSLETRVANTVTLRLDLPGTQDSLGNIGA